MKCRNIEKQKKQFLNRYYRISNLKKESKLSSTASSDENTSTDEEHAEHQTVVFSSIQQQVEIICVSREESLNYESTEFPKGNDLYKFFKCVNIQNSHNYSILTYQHRLALKPFSKRVADWKLSGQLVQDCSAGEKVLWMVTKGRTKELGRELYHVLLTMKEDEAQDLAFILSEISDIADKMSDRVTLLDRQAFSADPSGRSGDHGFVKSLSREKGLVYYIYSELGGL